MKKEPERTKSSAGAVGCSCCKVSAVVSIDERGQMVLPKELRERAKIQAGDKLAVLSWEMGDEVCCISIMKTDGFAEMVKEMLGPMMKEIMK